MFKVYLGQDGADAFYGKAKILAEALKMAKKLDKKTTDPIRSRSYIFIVTPKGKRISVPYKKR
ncbi:MAG: hypothetical protein Q7S28_02120 [bacterium]|nr:hypothetical protein [bacterium]